MSLEAEIKNLADMVAKNTETLEKVLAGREEALAAASRLAETTTSRRTTKKDDAPAADDKPAEPAAEERSTRRGRGRSEPEPEAKPAKSKAEEVQERFGAYINVKDVKERRDRLDLLRKVNDYFRVERISTVTGKDLDLALEMIADLEKGIIPKEIDDEDSGANLV